MDIGTQLSTLRKQQLAAVAGRIEGDIPAIRMDTDGQFVLSFPFQDTHYQNVNPGIESVMVCSSVGLPAAFDELFSCPFSLIEDLLCISAEELLQTTDFPPDHSLPLTCAFVIRGTFRNEAFVSITAVNILP